MIEREPGNFLARWSRLKRGGGELPSAPVTETPLPVLPDPQSLSFDDDFRDFLHAKVAESVKRVALKKLFHAPQFNVMDGLDVYIDDYSLPDPIDEAMLQTLAHARGLLFDAPPAATSEVEVAEVVAEPAAVLAEGSQDVG